jgi:glycosyltransferase involved in cell wall biosynthesis
LSPLYIKNVRDLRVRFHVWVRRQLSLKMIRRSDAILFPTQAMRDLVESHLSLDGLRSLVVPYGCDVAAFRQRAKETAWLPESIRRERRRFLLNVSHYCAQKNFTVLFRALAVLRRKGFLRPLVLTARLKRAPNCNFREDQAVIAQEHLEGQVVQLGAIAREHIPTLYQMAGLFVFPSYVESFGHPLVEAMAAGLPIVAADTPVNREICGPAAVYAGPFDAEDWAAQIKKLAETPARCEQLREACRARVSRFSWRAHVEAVLKASEEILKQKGRIP